MFNCYDGVSVSVTDYVVDGLNQFQGAAMTYAKALKIGKSLGMIAGFTLLSGLAQAQVGQPVFDTTAASDIISELNATTAQTQQITTGQNNEATLFQGLAGTNTATAQITGGILSQGFTNQANTDYQLLLGKGTADLANEYNVNANLIAVCTPGTMASGMAQATQNAQAAVVSYAGASGSSGGGGSGSNTTLNTTNLTADAYKTGVSAPARVQARNNMSCNTFGGQFDSFCNNAGARAYEDTIPAKYFTDDYLTFPSSATDIHVEALTAFWNHLSARMGGQPEPHSNDRTFYNTPQGQQAFDNQRTQVAYFNLAGMPIADFVGDHQALTSGDFVASLQQLYQNAGLTAPVISGQVSRAAILDALYRQPVENAKTTVPNTTGLGETQLLQQISVQLMLLNYLEYQRYQKDVKNQFMYSGILTGLSAPK
jgi:hypothetical protein